MLRPQKRRQKRKKGKPRRTEKPEASFGRFINFPSILHGIARISHGNSTTTIQQAIIQALYRLNEFKDAYPLSVADHVGTYDGEVAFEVGVADGLFFDYLNQEALQKLCNPLKSGEEYTVLDFLIVVAYRYSRGEKRISLNFDHYILRFSFYNGEVDASLFHSKGTRRMPLDEFMNLIIRRITIEIKQIGLKPIKVESIKTL